MATTIPAEFEISRQDPDGTGRIYACPVHLAHTVRVLLAAGLPLAVTPADPQIHGCKGHLEAWPEK